MKLTIFALLFLLSSTANACNNDGVYLRIGIGHKFAESDKITVDGVDRTVDYNGRASARIGVAAYKGTWSIGIDHHSQYDTGWPVNNKKEYYKTELFIDKRFKLMGF